MNRTMSYLLQHYVKNLFKNTTFHWPHENLFLKYNHPQFSPLAWLPKPYDDQHVSINNPTLEPRCYPFLRSTHVQILQFI